MRSARDKGVGKEVEQLSTPSTPRVVFGLTIGNDGVDSYSADPLPARNAFDAETEDIIAGIWGDDATHEEEPKEGERAIGEPYENPRVEEDPAEGKVLTEEKSREGTSPDERTFVNDIAAALVRSHYYSGAEPLPVYPGDFALWMYTYGHLPYEPTEDQVLLVCTKMRRDYLRGHHSMKPRVLRTFILEELENVHRPSGEALYEAKRLLW